MKITTSPKLIAVIAISFALAGIFYVYSANKQARFNPPDLTDRTEGKEIEDYFMDKLDMTYDEAKKATDNGVSFYVTGDTTLEGIIGNLYFYGLVKDEKAFREALEQTKDTTPGNEESIRVGKNGTINIDSFYGLKKGMTAWEVADILLNQAESIQGRDYNRIFMPGKPKSETPSERTSACTKEAKLCSDGSSVGRVPPDCDFAPCPEE